jgi:hypothetical protein
VDGLDIFHEGGREWVVVFVSVDAFRTKPRRTQPEIMEIKIKNQNAIQRNQKKKESGRKIQDKNHKLVFKASCLLNN